MKLCQSVQLTILVILHGSTKLPLTCLSLQKSNVNVLQRGWTKEWTILLLTSTDKKFFLKERNTLTSNKAKWSDQMQGLTSMVKPVSNFLSMTGEVTLKIFGSIDIDGNTNAGHAYQIPQAVISNKKEGAIYFVTGQFGL